MCHLSSRGTAQMQLYLGVSILTQWQYTLHHIHFMFSASSVYNLYKSLVRRPTKPVSHWEFRRLMQLNVRAAGCAVIIHLHRSRCYASSSGYKVKLYTDCCLKMHNIWYLFSISTTQWVAKTTNQSYWIRPIPVKFDTALKCNIHGGTPNK